jgi:hypothetical protein
MRRSSEIDLRGDTGMRSKMHALPNWGPLKAYLGRERLS